MEKGYSGSGPGPTAEILEGMKSSRKRFIQLAQILATAEARQRVAAAVMELRWLGDAA